MRVAAIVPAAGRGRRLKAGKPKPFVEIFRKPLLIHTLSSLQKSFGFTEIILAAPSGQIQSMRGLLDKHGFWNVRIVAGGKTRAESVYCCLVAVSDKSDWVLVHDAARPLLSKNLINRLLQAARRTGAAICAAPVTATVKRVDRARMQIIKTEDRNSLYLAQTPQVFRKEILTKAYGRLGKKAFLATDEAALLDGSPVRVKVISGEAKNIKITTPDDLELMKFYLKKDGA